jgi:DNA-directed RNA polymerase specialized sigma24 family protein
VKRDLIKRAVAGDSVAYAQIVRLVIGQFDVAAGLIIGNRRQARDAVTEALVRAWVNLRKPTEPDRFEPGLRGELVRSCQARIQRSSGAVIDEIHDIGDRAAAGQPSTAEERVRGALLGLDPDQRILLVLQDYLEVPVEEVAGLLGITLSTANGRLARARAAIGASPPRGSRMPGVAATDSPQAPLFEFARAADRNPVPYLEDVLRRVSRARRNRLARTGWLPPSVRPAAIGPSAMLVIALAIVVVLVAAPSLIGSRRSASSPSVAPSSAGAAATVRPVTPEPEPEIAVDCGYPAAPFDPENVELTGAWAGDDGGIYYIRQEGKRVWWNGMSGRDAPPPELGSDWSNVGTGVIKDDLTIDATWADVPRGDILGSGTLKLQIEDNGAGDIRIRKVDETGTGFGNSLWTPCEPL